MANNILTLDDFSRDEFGYWQRKHQNSCFPIDVQLFLYLDDDETELDDVVTDSYAMLIDQEAEIKKQFEQSLFELYLDELDNSRAIAQEYGKDPDEVAPLITKSVQIWPLIRYMEFGLQSRRYSGFKSPVLEIVFGTTWEPEHRFDVIFQNGCLDELY